MAKPQFTDSRHSKAWAIVSGHHVREFASMRAFSTPGTKAETTHDISHEELEAAADGDSEVVQQNNCRIKTEHEEQRVPKRDVHEQLKQVGCIKE
jgi:hypothetical protein